MIRICETYIECSKHIYIEHRNLEIRKTHNDFLVQVQNFLLPLSLKVLQHKERDTHSFYSGFSICPLPISCSTRSAQICLASASPESHPSSPEVGLNSTSWLFQNHPNPPHASGVWCHPHFVAPFPIWAIVTSLSDMSVPPVRVNTCVNVAPKLPMHWAERFSA